MRTLWCLNLGILSAHGMIFSNSLRATSEMCSSVSGTWRPMHKPSWFEVRRTAQKNNLTAHELFWRQKEDLPLLAHLSSSFETLQRNFIKEVIAIPKWKSFRRYVFDGALLVEFHNLLSKIDAVIKSQFVQYCTVVTATCFFTSFWACGIKLAWSSECVATFPLKL